MKKKLPPKKKLPFYAKVAGGNARSRPDRVNRRADGGPAVKALPKPTPMPALEKPDIGRDLDRDIGAINRASRTRLYKVGGGVKKRQEGGDVPLPKPRPSEADASPSVLGKVRDWLKTPINPGGEGKVGRQPYPGAGILRKSGGGVKKRQDGGEIEVSNKPPVRPDVPFEHTGPLGDEGGWQKEEEMPTKVARGINTINRTIGRPPNLGAASVQRYGDMKRAQQISDEVPRRGLKGGGKVSR